LRRAALFSWQSTAQRTLEVYREVAQRPRFAAVPVDYPSMAGR